MLRNLLCFLCLFSIVPGFAESDTAQARKYYKLMMTTIDSDSLQTVSNAQKAIAFARSGSAPAIEADVYNNLGVFYSYNGTYSTSDSLNNLALAIRTRIKDSIGMAVCIMNQGHNYYQQNDFTHALPCYLKAADIRAKINDKKGLAGSYIWIGNVYQTGLENYSVALTYYAKALPIYQEINDEIGQGYVYLNLGNIYMHQKDYPRSQENFQKSLDIKIKYNDERGMAILYNNLGNLYFEQKKYEEALPYYLKSLALKEKKGDKTELITAYINIANTYMLTNTHAGEVKDMLDKVISMSKEVHFKIGLRDGYLSLFEYYKRQKNYDKAIESYQMHVLYKDSVLNAQTANQMNDLLVKYETQAKEQKISLLKNENTIQKLSISRRNTIIGFVVGLLLLAVITAVLLYNRYKLKQEAEMRAEVMKQKDIAARGMVEAEERERTRIAADLHDGIGQLFTAVRMNLEVLVERYVVKQSDADALADKTMAMVDESCNEVRAIAHQMMPNALMKSGLVAALRDFINKIQSDKLKISIETRGINERLDNNTEAMLYRVIQESVNNVIKHAEASSLDILLLCDEKEITVSIEDNGKGFNTEDKSKFTGIGLKNMLSRVAFLKGTVDISSSPGKGTLVAIHLPRV